MPSFYIPLSGLNAESTALNTIANNLSNMNTTGYKSQTTSFSDLFHQQIGTSGSGDEIQVGSGVQVATNRTDFSGGSISTTGVATDAAINGNGFFVLDSGGNQLYTRNGAFQTSPDGKLETSGGLAVMGYGAIDGVIKSSGGLTDIVVPTGQVMSPAATSSFGMTQNLASTAAVGASTTGQVKVYDSLGNTYEATVTYTKTGNNAWSYRVSLPDSLTAEPATPAAADTMVVTATLPTPTEVIAPTTASMSAGTTVPSAVSALSPSAGTTNYNFGSYTDPSSGLTEPSTVDPATNLNLTGLTVGGVPAIFTAPTVTAGETVTEYAAALNAVLMPLGNTGVTITESNGQLSIVGPSTMTIFGGITQDMKGTTYDYDFSSNATVDPTSNLTITGQKADGTSATIIAPTVTARETVTQYAEALSLSLTAAKITNVAVSSTAGQLSIVGANMFTTGGVSQGLKDTTINYNFGSSATVNPSTNLTIVGPTGGNPPTAISSAPGVTAGETVAEYAIALTNALKLAGIKTGADGVSVTAIGGQLSIVGPAATLRTAGIANQNLTATTISYNFGAKNGSVATLDPTTNLTITGQTTNGSTATTAAPTIAAGETLAQYATALTNALTAAGITGVEVSSTAGGQLSIVGANISTSGNVVQNPVASTNATGMLTFDASGKLVSPSSDVKGITFAGLTDGAATMSMDFDLFGASGTGNISQTAGDSTTTGLIQNGYASGQYESFAIGSDGKVTATYSNKKTQDVGQLAIATVTNLQGLVAVGSSNYQATSASGNASVGVAGSGGRGTLEGRSLEASNVNISAEFSNLIIAQRAFEANSKAVTTFDTVTQETINMIR